MGWKRTAGHFIKEVDDALEHAGDSLTAGEFSEFYTPAYELESQHPEAFNRPAKKRKKSDTTTSMAVSRRRRYRVRRRRFRRRVGRRSRRVRFRRRRISKRFIKRTATSIAEAKRHFVEFNDTVAVAERQKIFPLALVPRKVTTTGPDNTDINTRVGRTIFAKGIKLNMQFENRQSQPLFIKWFIGYEKGQANDGNIFVNHSNQSSTTLPLAAPRQHDSLYVRTDKYKYRVMRSGVFRLAPAGDDQFHQACKHKSIYIPLMRKIRFESLNTQATDITTMPNYEIRFMWGPERIDDIPSSNLWQVKVRSTLYFTDS